MTALVIEAPTDAQLDYIRDLCRKADVPTPDAIYSRQEASVIIEQLRAGRYNWREYAHESGVLHNAAA